MSSEYYQLEEEEASFDFSQILAIAQRRFFFFLIPAILGILITIAVIYLIPQRYESYGTVLVESQQIPVQFVQSTVTSDPNQRITIIKQRVMTRRNLLKIIDKYDVFKEDRKRLSVSRLIEEMQKLITLDVITSDVGKKRRGATTIAFKVSFQHENPNIAAKVANELVTLFLSENVRTRTARASETTEFLRTEADKLRTALTAAENAISEFKRDNSESLPEHMNLQLSILERTQAESRATELQINSLREEQKYLGLEITAARAGDKSATGQIETVQSTTELELQRTKDGLTKALTQFTEKHPDIKALKRRITALEQQIENDDVAELEDGIETKSNKSTKTELSRLVERIQIRLNSNADAMSTATQQLTALRKKATDTESRIIKTPEVERGLSVLNRTYREILAKYQELEAKQGKAKLAQNLEEEKKAERFLLLEPPVVPTEPIWPDRLKFFGIGGFLAFAGGIGTAVLMELVDRRVRTAKELETLLKHPPLVSIPFIKTRRDIQKKRYKLGAMLLIPSLLGILGAASIHMLYKPLDVLFYRTWVYLEKLNLLPF